MVRTNAHLTASTSAGLLGLLSDGEQGLYDRCGQLYILEQLIACFKHILNDTEVEKEVWVKEVSTAVSALNSQSPIVGRTALVVITAIEAAPWSLEDGEWIGSVNAIAYAMKHAAKIIQHHLTQAENDGTDLDLCRDPADYTHESTDEGSDEPYGDRKESLIRKKAGRKPGFKLIGGSRRWGTDEILHMLRTVRDNIHKTWDERVEAHNNTYVVPVGILQRGPRSKEGIRQRLDDMTRLAENGLKERLEAKIAEFEASGSESSVCKMDNGTVTKADRA
ncbi:hypothetical protein CERZMDRAFT_94486 [Cercospora zeae-maydis SCOH1-5]|uniref:Uncharacterized protein n=1 Tax=Cercospora zeae-maydis SCOH1-5 TaxID=717836 RepID=A0A6A6FRN6_9PEZI|nr:hypothetical protein CERZMDRAFT_94486 [Cercospora zeae-maydis SCOH1-5]